MYMWITVDNSQFYTVLIQIYKQPINNIFTYLFTLDSKHRFDLIDLFKKDLV